MSFPSARIDGDALRHNLAAVRRIAPDSRVVAVIKANAYGHGMIAVARALIAADAFGVARFDEAVALRAAGISIPILLLEGVFTADELQVAGREQFQLVVHSFEQLTLLEQSAATHRFAVWLKLNTGMNRLGFRPDEFETALQRLKRCACVGTVKVMTHLAGAEEPGGETSRVQLDEFRALTDTLGLEHSIANSAGLIAWPEARTQWVRPGLMLYGISPIPGVDAAAIGLHPVMTLSTQLIALREVPRGESVGYNGIWQANRDSRIGIAAIGYGDGYPRHMRTGAPVLVNGSEASVVGRVSMDMMAVDVTDLPEARVGAAVVLWGEGLPAERVAPYADTIPYELVCGVKQRVRMEWLGGD